MSRGWSQQGMEACTSVVRRLCAGASRAWRHVPVWSQQEQPREPGAAQEELEQSRSSPGAAWSSSGAAQEQPEQPESPQQPEMPGVPGEELPEDRWLFPDLDGGASDSDNGSEDGGSQPASVPGLEAEQKPRWGKLIPAADSGRASSALVWYGSTARGAHPG